MKNALILIGIGVGAYGIWLNAQKKSKRAIPIKKLPVVKAPPVTQEIVPDVVLQEYDVNPRNIFAGGTYRSVPWPADINQNYVNR